ncbi:MAG: two-component system regulatory protein YycI [Clostridia bacterium]|nr:two-component system regulatory protein YycI [Clostridia bacterium]
MNQVRIKWVFILLFLVINLFLAYLLYQSHWRETSISEETAAHAVSVLEQRGVVVNGSLIPRGSEKMREVSVRNIIENSSAFVSRLPEAGWRREEEGFSRGKDRISFENGHFSYEGRLPVEENASGDQLSREVCKQLEQLSLNLEGIKLKTIEQLEAGTVLEYVQTYDGYEIFGTGLTVSVEKNEIISVQGIWLEPVNTRSKRQDTLFATEALMRFAEDEKRPSTCRVTEIRSGYYISEIDESTDEAVAHKVMQMLPVFQITASSGEKFYYDARSPRE